MTKEEKIAWRHWASVYKMGDCSPKQKEIRIKISLQKGWMTDDDTILKLLEMGLMNLKGKWLNV